MTTEPENLVIELLRAVRADVAEMRSEQREQRVRLAAIKRHLAHLERDGAEFRAEIGGRFERIHDRLDRIERRLDLSDQPA
ncbi:hypothetical protein ACFW16_26865 [Inquilinus sp. NPDC058860]|uniref:hypothetical protein n=1 Tax=Inquilinus sp. NPDC058860 TaxID=3346652 RepID=UPI00367476F8